jgi:peptidyl-prolyl cis-trans isomerase C
MKKYIFINLIALFFSAASLAQTTVPVDKKLRDLIFQDIKKQGIDKDPATIASINTAQDALLIRAWGQKILSTRPVTSELKENIYKELALTLGDQEYKVIHFFTSNNDAAEIISQKFKNSDNWSELDPKKFLSAEIKFSLTRTDWINLTAIQPEFRNSLKTLKKGEHTALPIKTKDGFHVIGVVDTRSFKMPTIENMDKELNSIAERRILDQYIQSLIN